MIIDVVLVLIISEYWHEFSPQHVILILLLNTLNVRCEHAADALQIIEQSSVIPHVISCDGL